MPCLSTKMLPCLWMSHFQTQSCRLFSQTIPVAVPFLLYWGLLRSRHQDGIKFTWISIEELSVRENKDEAKTDLSKDQDSKDWSWVKERGKEGWMRASYNTRKVKTGLARVSGRVWDKVHHQRSLQFPRLVQCYDCMIVSLLHYSLVGKNLCPMWSLDLLQMRKWISECNNSTFR